MGLHAEVPLISFVRIAFALLMHVRIALLLVVFGRTGRVDDASIDNCSPIDFQAILLEVLIDQLKRAIAQMMACHQMMEFIDRGVVGDGLFAQVNIHTSAWRGNRTAFRQRLDQTD